MIQTARPWRMAAIWLVTLGTFFFLSYGFANWVTSQRASVPFFAFEWERSIPFLPWTIVPYWSTDLLYAASLFICRTRRELTTHVRRLLAAQILSVWVFLLFPLRFSFARPAAEGFFGWLFNLLAGFDPPFNEAPSLHLSLTVILWARYSAHLRGAALWLMRGWLVLASISTLTTYQHHFVDLPAGMALGFLVIVLFPLRQPSADMQRRRLSAAYLTGALIVASVAFRFGGATWLLLWPALALSIVSGIYWTGDARGFRKSNGKIGQPMRLLLSPYLTAARLNSLWWTRRDAAQEFSTGVWIGGVPQARGMSSVVDLTAELLFEAAGDKYRGVPMLDLMAPTVEQLEAAVSAINELTGSRPTLVCCALGYSRSATAAVAWLVASGTSECVDLAILQLLRIRPQVRLSEAHRVRLAEWAAARR